MARRRKRPHNVVVDDTEGWIQSKWRPFMGWQYMAVCTFDFILFPIIFAVIQGIFNGKVDMQWHPITLEGAGLYHISMGAILGVTAWSRGQEKMIDARLRTAIGSDDQEEEDDSGDNIFGANPQPKVPTPPTDPTDPNKGEKKD